MLIEVRPFRKGEEKDILELDKMSGNCVAKQFIDDSQDKDFVNDYSWGLFEEESHRCLGYCTIGIYDDVEEILPHISEAYCLSDVYIRDDEQGKGYGSILVKQAIQKKIAMEEELPVVLDVLDKNLFHFYDRLGFKPVSDDEDIWSMVNMYPKDNVLVAMSYDIKFNKPVKDKVAYFSPGGYEIKNCLTKEDIQFDFTQSECGYSTEDASTIEVLQRYFDDDVSNGRKVYLQDIKESQFTEFYLDYDAPEDVVPVEIRNATMTFFDGKEYTDYELPLDQLKRISKILRGED